MLRTVLAFIAGFVTFFVVVTLIQMASGMVFGAPPADVMMQPQAMADFVANMPAGAYVLLLAGYALGSFAAGFVMRVISRSESQLLALIIGAIGTFGWIANVAMIPHPLWLVIAGLFVYFPFALLGHKAAAGAVRRS
jgi:hypothetical protein